jgi:hypothetical protein
MHGLRMHSPANRPLRFGGGSSSRSVTPRSTASILPNTNGKAPAGREAPADVPSGATNAAEGAPAEKQKRKPKKKGWKGYAMVYYDDDGNVIEERLRDETLPNERSTISILPEARPSRGACRHQGGGCDGSYRREECADGVDVANTAAMSDVVTGKRSRTSSTPLPDHSTLHCMSHIFPLRPLTSFVSPNCPQSNLHTARPPLHTTFHPRCASTFKPSFGAHSNFPRSSPGTLLSTVSLPLFDNNCA